MYYVYILKCSDKTLYTGITNNLEKRLGAHNHLITGAKYTRTRRPVKLVYSKKFRTKSKALKREYEIKNVTRNEKLNLITQNSPRQSR